MEDIYDRYKRMTFAELRKYLKDQRTLQKMLYAIPAGLAVLGIMNYCMQGWSTYPAMINEMSQQKTISANLTTFGIFDWIVVLLTVPMLPFEKTHLKFDFASSILMAAYTLIKLLLFSSFDILSAGMIVYYFFAAYFLRNICKRIVFLKNLPDYPFTAAVELERQRDLEMMKYSENNYVNKKLIKEAEKKVEGTLEEKMAQLPKRKIEEYKISRGDFDDTEEEYSDKLIGEDLKRDYEKPDFEEINEDYKEDISTEDKLLAERGDRIDEVTEAYNAELASEPNSASSIYNDNIDEVACRRSCCPNLRTRTAIIPTAATATGRSNFRSSRKSRRNTNR